MIYNSLAPNSKRRAGFFQDNIFQKPLRSLEEFQHYESMLSEPIPAETKEQVLIYLDQRRERVRKMNRMRGTNFEDFSFESEAEIVGT